MNQHADTSPVLQRVLRQALQQMNNNAISGDMLTLNTARAREDGSPETVLLNTTGLSAEDARALIRHIEGALKNETGRSDIRVIASGDTPAAPAMNAGAKRIAEPREKRRPAGVKQIVQVISGKGGAGKTTVSAALALAYQRAGKRVALVDADIYGPSFPSLFDIKDKPAVDPDSGRMRPIHHDSPYGELPLMSLGFITGQGDALAWRGPMAGKALMQLFFSVTWPDIDIMIIDMPPGTGDAHLTASASLDIAYAYALTQPSTLSEADAVRAVSFCKKTGTPVKGIIENMAYLDHNGMRLTPFGSGGGAGLAAAGGVPLLASLPLLPDGGTRPLKTAETLSDYLTDIVSL